mgnify:CR=1 FL=1
MSGCSPALRKVGVVNKPHLGEAIEDRLTHGFGHSLRVEDFRKFATGVGPPIQSLEADLSSLLIPLVVSQFWEWTPTSATQNSTSPV